MRPGRERQARNSFGDDEDSYGRYAWYEGNSGEKTHPVGYKQPNSWGLYDICGNVSEWVKYLYEDLPHDPVTDYSGPSSGSDRVYRGGGWGYSAGGCLSAAGRNGSYGWPNAHGDSLGFRSPSPRSSRRGEQARQGTWSDPEGSGKSKLRALQASMSDKSKCCWRTANPHKVYKSLVGRPFLEVKGMD
jgi:hypothetical protein